MLTVGRLSIGSQVNRRGTTLIRLCNGNVLKMHWSTNSNDTAQVLARGLAAAAARLAGSHLRLLSGWAIGQIWFVSVKWRCQKESKGDSKANEAKGKVHSKTKLIIFSSAPFSLYKLVQISSPCYSNISSLVRFLPRKKNDLFYRQALTTLSHLSVDLPWMLFLNCSLSCRQSPVVCWGPTTVCMAFLQDCELKCLP